MAISSEGTVAGSPARDQEVIAPSFHHINLKTTRKDEMIAWYTVVCGMRVNYNSPFGAFLSNDRANHRIALLAVPGLTPDPDRRTHDGMHHSAFEYASLADLDSTFRRLLEEGIEPVFCVDHRNTIAYYYEDPDGNLVELQCDAFGDWEASTAWMKKELLEITEHPFGVIVDPAKVSEDVLAGVSLKEIQRRADEGAYPWEGEPDLRLPWPPADAPPMFK
ncbi:MAG: VOC family protein [Actinobacteria bacterium]|nr:VOC family protein [Actinomycetota bacterium]